MYRIFLFSTLLAFSRLCAQDNECLKDFDYLVKKIRNDYAGYTDKVTPATMKSLSDLEASLRTKITGHPDSCGKYLSRYVQWFRDEHMFVSRVRGKGSNKTNTKPMAVKHFLRLGQDSLLILGRKTSSAEGIWKGFWGRMAVIYRPDEGKYYGVALEYNGYEPGQVILELSQPVDGVFPLVRYDSYSDYMPEKGSASLHADERILELHDFTRLVRESASARFDEALLNSYIPEFPNGVNLRKMALPLDDSTFFLRITSFGDSSAIEMVAKHRKEILSRPDLIIDIRFNGGGLDEYWQDLEKLIYTNPYESKGVEWLAGEGNIRMFEDAIRAGDYLNGEEGKEWIEKLVEAMKKNPGGFVIHPDMGGNSMVKEDTVYPKPSRVGIIINEGNGSSAEQFILAAKESKKVILFGNRNTAGVLDYSNRVNELFPSGKYEFYWPVSRSMRLPEHPIDNTGIPPDVKIPFPGTLQLFDRLDSWVYFVSAYLKAIPVNSN